MSAEFEIRGAWSGDEDGLDRFADEIDGRLRGVGECVGYDHDHRTEQGPVTVLHVIAPDEGAVQPFADTLARETGTTWLVQRPGEGDHAPAEVEIV